MKKLFTLILSAAAVAMPAMADSEDNPLLVMLEWDSDVVVNVGDPLTIQAYCDGGEKPYVCEWYNQAGEKIATGEVLNVTVDKSQSYRFIVTSADNQVFSAKANVLVNTAEKAVATFEDLTLAPESSWKYDEYANDYVTADAFISGSYRFGNFPTVSWGSWGGFCYANETANTSTGYMEQFRNVVGGGAENSANYGVVYMGDPTYPAYEYDTTVKIAANEKGAVVPGIYVTNSAYAVNSMVNGDGFCTKFSTENGDYMTLVITGYDAAGSATGKVEVALAEFRNVAEGEGFILSEWKWVDLSSLGAISKFDIRYTGSQVSGVPSYVCIDQVGATKPDETSVENVVLADANIFMPTENCLSIVGIEGCYTLNLYSVAGVKCESLRLSGANTVSVSSLESGIYLAEILDNNGTRKVLRFVKR